MQESNINLNVPPKTVIAIGEQFAEGVVNCLSRIVLLVCIVIAIIQCLLNAFDMGVDDSDRDGWHRSGLKVRTDYKTGIQYLESSNGSLTPRLSK